APDNEVTGENGAKVRARIVGEGANGPTTPEADEILQGNGRFVIPDVLANAGGVTVSYFEWVQALQEYFWSEKEVNAKLKELMDRAFQAVYAVHVERKIDMRRAGDVVGGARGGGRRRMGGRGPECRAGACPGS